MRHVVGQPILAAAGFQPACSDRGCIGLSREMPPVPRVKSSLPHFVRTRPGIRRRRQPAQPSSGFARYTRKDVPIRRNGANPPARVSRSDGRRSVPAGASLATETGAGATQREPAESRLQPGLAAPHSGKPQTVPLIRVEYRMLGAGRLTIGRGMASCPTKSSRCATIVLVV